MDNFNSLYKDLKTLLKKYETTPVCVSHLLECPFCGGEASLMYQSYDPVLYEVHCLDSASDQPLVCKSGRIGTKYFTSESQAIEAWNTRYKYEAGIWPKWLIEHSGANANKDKS